MNPKVKIFYQQGANSQRDDMNPYFRNSQVMAFHAWQAGHYDAHGKLAKGKHE